MAARQEGQRFPSRRDLWLGLVLWKSATLPLVLMVAGGIWPGAAVIGGYAAFVTWLWFGTWYEIGETHLVARAGPFRWRVPLETIRTITPSRLPISSPALSLERLLVRYGRRGFLLISPADRTPFLDAMRQRCPTARIEG